MITIPGVLCIVYWCFDKIIMNLFSYITEKQHILWRKIYLPKYRMIKFTCTRYLCRIIQEKKDFWYQKEITFTSFHWKREFKKISRWYVIYSYWEKKKNQFINDISDFNNKHIIYCYNKTKCNIPEEPRYMSYMTSTGLINDNDESRYSVKSSFQVIFFNIYFQTFNHEYWLWKNYRNYGQQQRWL